MNDLTMTPTVDLIARKEVLDGLIRRRRAVPPSKAMCIIERGNINAELDRRSMMTNLADPLKVDRSPYDSN